MRARDGKAARAMLAEANCKAGAMVQREAGTFSGCQPGNCLKRADDKQGNAASALP